MIGSGGLRRRAGVVILLLWTGSLACGATTVPAAATAFGTPVRWSRSEIVLRPVVPGAASGLTVSDLARVLGDAARGWNEATRSCGVPRLRIGAALSAPARAVQDESSVVMIRGDSWCPERSGDPGDCHDRRSAGITRLYPRHVPGDARDGEVAEADVEINAAHFRWSPNGDRPGTQSLEALLAHELGHVLGLDHPSPSDRDPSGSDSIMYPDPVEPGRPLVARPRAAEVAALCALYAQGRAAAPSD